MLWGAGAVCWVSRVSQRCSWQLALLPLADAHPVRALYTTLITWSEAFVGSAAGEGPDTAGGQFHAHGRHFVFLKPSTHLDSTRMQLATGRPPLADMHPMRALFTIPKSRPPELPASNGHSEQLRDFVAACLQPDPGRRPGAASLLAHPLVRSNMLPNEFFPGLETWENLNRCSRTRDGDPEPSACWRCTLVRRHCISAFRC